MIPTIIMDLISGAWANNPTDRPDFKFISGFLNAFRQKKLLPNFWSDKSQISTSSPALSSIQVLEKVDSKSTIKEDSRAIVEIINVASKLEKKKGLLQRMDGLSKNKKIAMSFALVLLLAGIILGIVFGIKGSSTSSTGNMDSTTSLPKPSGSLPRQNISETGPSSGTGFVPAGIKIAPVPAGSYVLGQVDCNGYTGTSCEEYCIRLYGWHYKAARIIL